MYIESESYLYSQQDYYYKNTALNNGGGISATTRSYFSLSNSKFVQNYAGSDSAISAEKTSTTTTFIINNCLFTLNIATSNTLSFKNANGDIINSIFSSNLAKIYTQNIFVSFSVVNVTGTSLKNDVSKNSTYDLE